MRHSVLMTSLMVPVYRDGVLVGMRFELVESVYDDKGRRSLVPTGEPDVRVPCDTVLVAVGQENAFPWIARDCGIEFDRWGLPVLGDGGPITLPPNANVEIAADGTIRKKSIGASDWNSEPNRALITQLLKDAGQ